MTRHSERAKRNMRKQMNAQLRLLRGIMSDKAREYYRVLGYRKYKLPGQKRMEKATKNGWLKAVKDWKALRKRKEKLHREGKI